MINNPILRPLFIFLLYFLFNINLATAEQNKISTLKVAYIYNIAKFTSWPDTTWNNPEDAFVLCAYGEDEVTSELSMLTGKKVATHPISVVEVKSDQDYRHCHVFYISTDDRNLYRYLLSQIELQKVLTITDQSPHFTSGGFINLVEHNNRLRFQVSNQQLSTTQLVLSSKLLKLSILVDD
ncbi:YfiR family protein [Psychromonas sp. KJ10-2]|uniref:YfiR family protein n=1 Tax=Psychromonas sp. KJ10-2 TaxID=3391822 RepID=UPI0039B671E9